jgi:hypothetical protein
MFITALFAITKFWKKPRCPKTKEWIKKMCYIYTLEHYSAMKKSEITLFAGKWMELEIIILSEVIHLRRTKFTFLSCVEARPKRLMYV